MTNEFVLVYTAHTIWRLIFRDRCLKWTETVKNS